jgi:uncharacterized protein
MTPQERELITTLFDRLASLESAPRDPEAERAIAQGLARAPHAIYPLVQSVLVQDEALKAANARIEELQAALGEPDAGRPQGGFLDTMRDSLFGRHDAPRGSVPSVRPGGSPWANAPGYRAETPAGPAAMPAAAPGYGGGSFLGTAAATAAGMVGGGLLLGGIQSMLGGGRHHGAFAGTFDQPGAGRDAGSPWSGGGQGSSDLARQAGLDDIGRSPSGGDAGGQSRAGLLGGDDRDGDEHDSDDHDGDDQDTDGDDSDDSDLGDDSGDSSGEPDVG